MKQLIFQLAGAAGPSGSETEVRDILSGLLQPHVDELKVDVLGNLLAWKKGTANSGKTVLLAANMDEPGVMAIHCEKNGFIRIVPVGSLNPLHLIGERVRFANGVLGVIGAAANTSLKDITFADLYVDIGAESQAEAAKRLPIGTAGAIDKPVFQLTENRLAGKSLDNRVGCAVLVEVTSRLGAYPHDLAVLFAAQKEVGSRGVKAASFKINADFALTVGAAKAGDMPSAERSVLSLGIGPAIKVMDRGVVVPPAIKQRLVDAAERLQIPYQLEVSPDGNSDAGQILLSKDGVPTGGVSIPVRYGQALLQVADLRDIELASRLVLETLQNER
ncbi:zinc-binding metallopeptidase family protein [Effusibacillus pohliae]|uniref:M42 family peptidase n=1 Tax=Effusibacillus pohliae TaxID=232270 RepID=UPI0003664CA9|nr:M42 family peptidase [Effusibacillus pohliae]